MLLKTKQDDKMQISLPTWGFLCQIKAEYKKQNKKNNSLHTNSWVVITGNPLAENFMINYVSLHILQKALSYEPELILQPSYYYVCDHLQVCHE